MHTILRGHEDGRNDEEPTFPAIRQLQDQDLGLDLGLDLDPDLDLEPALDLEEVPTGR
ncbi:hypothetical protein OG604_40650 [Streptomyces sp. NBC_01231]|nr:hypothetical protein OG604_40650 [Streptomyces sp. NBC_01231]